MSNWKLGPFVVLSKPPLTTRLLATAGIEIVRVRSTNAVRPSTPVLRNARHPRIVPHLLSPLKFFSFIVSHPAPTPANARNLWLDRQRECGNVTCTRLWMSIDKRALNTKTKGQSTMLNYHHGSGTETSVSTHLCSNHLCGALGVRTPRQMSGRLHRSPSFDPTSINIFVIHTSPRICVHSDTRLPTTCPQRLFASMRLKANAHAAPVITRNTVSEWLRKNSRVGDFHVLVGFLLSADPLSCRCLVKMTVTSTPDQSAMALPKNEPRWVEGSARV